MKKVLLYKNKKHDKYDKMQQNVGRKEKLSTNGGKTV